MILRQGVSEDGLFTLQLEPGRYQLIAQYRDEISHLLGVFFDNK
jgi:hypothetical protein